MRIRIRTGRMYPVKVVCEFVCICIYYAWSVQILHFDFSLLYCSIRKVRIHTPVHRTLGFCNLSILCFQQALISAGFCMLLLYKCLSTQSETMLEPVNRCCQNNAIDFISHGLALLIQTFIRTKYTKSNKKQGLLEIENGKIAKT